MSELEDVTVGLTTAVKEIALEELSSILLTGATFAVAHSSSNQRFRVRQSAVGCIYNLTL